MLLAPRPAILEVARGVTPRMIQDLADLGMELRVSRMVGADPGWYLVELVGPLADQVAYRCGGHPGPRGCYCARRMGLNLLVQAMGLHVPNRKQLRLELERAQDYWGPRAVRVEDVEWNIFDAQRNGVRLRPGMVIRVDPFGPPDGRDIVTVGFHATGQPTVVSVTQTSDYGDAALRKQGWKRWRRGQTFGWSSDGTPPRTRGDASVQRRRRDRNHFGTIDGAGCDGI